MASFPRVLGAAALGLLSIYVGCSANDGGAGDDTFGVPGSGGSAGTQGGGSGGSGQAGAGATAGGGSGGSGGSSVIETDSGGGTDDASLMDGSGVTNDAAIDAADDACSDTAEYIPGPLARTCAAATDNECDGSADVNSALPNQAFGNGFDDDCDGQVDEGCLCPPDVAAGETRECWLVSGSQVDANTGEAVGWCASNSRGTQSCVVEGTGENATRKWEGQCRGAQPPFAEDVCANGDFDCDGLTANSQTQDCSCDEDIVVECPTDPLVTSPYPNPNNLLRVDGHDWITTGDPTSATNWGWRVVGGDCDNILPHPSFAIYPNQGAGGQMPVGNKRTDLGPAMNQTGYAYFAGSGAGANFIHPAFALSGDYLVTGSFEIGGNAYECTVKVQVRAPGIRAELCWSPMPNDVDLHFARLQNSESCSNNGHGWFSSCNGDETGDDCYFSSSTGCTGFGSNPSAWGYARSPNSACQGWASRRGLTPCDNPRLDADNITCNANATNPSNTAGLFGGFCAAENINLDNPNDGDRFAIGAHAYGISGDVRPHVNIYCNGERRLSLGYDPNTNSNFPVLKESGGASGGDFWQAAIVEAVVDGGGNLTDCIISPVASAAPKADKDGSTSMCVDTDPQNDSSQTGISNWLFTPGGGYPANAEDLCWH